MSRGGSGWFFFSNKSESLFFLSIYGKCRGFGQNPSSAPRFYQVDGTQHKYEKKSNFEVAQVNMYDIPTDTIFHGEKCICVLTFSMINEFSSYH